MDSHKNSVLVNKKSGALHSILLALILSITIGLSLTSCSKTENFEAFYDEFMTDSVFQKSRINFPLPIRTSALSEEGSRADFITKENWVIHQKFDVEKEGYRQKNVNRPPKMICIVYDDPTKYGFTHEFIPDAEGKWFLVAYSDYCPISDDLLKAE